MKKVLLALGILSMMVGFGMKANAAEVIHACAGKVTGILRMVHNPSQCKKWETPVSWNAAGQPGLAGGSVKVFDANGQYLGIVIDSGTGLSNFIFYNETLGMPVSLDARTGDISSLSGTDFLLFTEEDCGGSPYVYGNSTMYCLRKFDEKYYVGESVEPTFKEIKSELVHSWQTGLSECQPWPEGSDEAPLVPATEVSGSEIPFTIPVKLPLRFDTE